MMDLGHRRRHRLALRNQIVRREQFGGGAQRCACPASARRAAERARAGLGGRRSRGLIMEPCPTSLSGPRLRVQAAADYDAAEGEGACYDVTVHELERYRSGLS